MMYYFFSANYPAIIKLNGIYYGTITDTIKSISIDDGSVPLVEICPLNSKECPFCFLPNASFLSNPPESACVTDLNGGYLIKLLDYYKSPIFNVLCQQKFPFATVTVFNENGLKLSLETADDFFAKAISINAQKAEISCFEYDTKKFIAVQYFGKSTLLTVYSINKSIKEIFNREISSFSTENGFSTTEILTDMAKHKITINWDINEEFVKEKSRVIEKSKTFCLENLTEKLIPYAFLEEFYASGNVLDYLSEEIKELSDRLSEYFGEFIGIMPPPIFRNPNEIGLIKAKNTNRYYVEYFCFDVENKKICNIKKQE